MKSITHFIKNFHRAHWATQLLVYAAMIAAVCLLLHEYKLAK